MRPSPLSRSSSSRWDIGRGVATSTSPSTFACMHAIGVRRKGTGIPSGLRIGEPRSKAASPARKCFANSHYRTPSYRDAHRSSSRCIVVKASFIQSITSPFPEIEDENNIEHIKCSFSLSPSLSLSLSLSLAKSSYNQCFYIPYSSPRYRIITFSW